MKRITDFLRRVLDWILRRDKRPGNSGPLPPFKLAPIPAPARPFAAFRWQHERKAARRRRIAKARRVHP